MRSAWPDFFFLLAQFASLFFVLVAYSMHAHLVCISVYVSVKPKKKTNDLNYSSIVFFYNKLISECKNTLISLCMKLHTEWCCVYAVLCEAK